MKLLFILLLFAGLSFDLLFAASSVALFTYTPPLLLVIASIIEAKDSFKGIYVIVALGGFVLDSVGTEFFGTHGIILFTSLLLGNLLLRSFDDSVRKTLLKIGIVSTSYIVISAVVW